MFRVTSEPHCWQQPYPLLVTSRFPHRAVQLPPPSKAATAVCCAAAASSPTESVCWPCLHSHNRLTPIAGMNAVQLLHQAWQQLPTVAQRGPVESTESVCWPCSHTHTQMTPNTGMRYSCLHQAWQQLLYVAQSRLAGQLSLYGGGACTAPPTGNIPQTTPLTYQRSILPSCCCI